MYWWCFHYILNFFVLVTLTMRKIFTFSSFSEQTVIIHIGILKDNHTGYSNNNPFKISINLDSDIQLFSYPSNKLFTSECLGCLGLLTIARAV